MLTLRGPHEVLHVAVHHDHDGVVEQVVTEENLRPRGKLLSHLLGNTLAVEDGVHHHHHSLLLEPVAQHRLGISQVAVFLQAELTTIFNVITACSIVQRKQGCRCTSNLIFIQVS